MYQLHCMRSLPFISTSLLLGRQSSQACILLMSVEQPCDVKLKQENDEDNDVVHLWSMNGPQHAHVLTQQRHTVFASTCNNTGGYTVQQQMPHMETMSDHITIRVSPQPVREVQPAQPLDTMIPHNPIPMNTYTSNVGFQDNRITY
jgi:hypothetical protein